jgi:phage baseplate assembly protein W
MIKGVLFPFQKRGIIPYAGQDDAQVQSNVIHILRTHPGERVMRPDFGVSNYNYLFENLQNIAKLNIGLSIYSNLLKYEPRANIVSQDIIYDKVNGATMVDLKIQSITLFTVSVVV